jgi:hypothetical protein
MRTALRVGTTAVAVCLAAVSLAAQTTPTAGSQTSRGKAGSKAGEKITISGCVERADQVAPATTPAATVDSLSFVLINAAPQTAGTSGTAGTARSAASMDKGYRLDAEVGKLNPHVGHKVEIAGTVVEPATTNGAASAANGPKVKVDTIKMLSETCAR